MAVPRDTHDYPLQAPACQMWALSDLIASLRSLFMRVSGQTARRQLAVSSSGGVVTAGHVIFLVWINRTI